MRDPQCCCCKPARLLRRTLPLLLMILASAPVSAQDKPIQAGGAQPEVLMEAGAAPDKVGATAAGKSEALPTAAPESPRATLIVSDFDLERVLDSLREQTGVKIEARGKSNQVRIQKLQIQDSPLEEILERITKPNNLVWVRQSPSLYQIYDQETYTQEVVRKQAIRHSFQLSYISATELENIIKPILTPDVGVSSADARTNRLIVTDLPDKINIIENIKAEFDVQLYSMVFELQNADPDELASRLKEIASESAEIQVDTVNRIIVVKDTFERIKQMEQLVALLDRDQEIVCYNLNNLGLDGEIIEEIVSKFIEPLITKDAVMDFQQKLGRLIVRDTHSVQLKIQDVLKSLDTPRKQVLIEGELLSVQITDTLNLGTEWEFANDLQAAIDDDIPGISDDPDIVNSRGLPVGTIGSSGLSFLDLGKNYRVALTAALTNSDTRILLRPRLIIASGEEGVVTDGQDQPVLNTYYNNYNNTTNNYSSSSQSFVTTGLTITIRPMITNRGLIEMYVSFDNSTPIIVADIGNGIRGVGSNTQRAETYMIMPSGQTRVIGGLISNNKTLTSSGVPVLSRIPYMGWLFGNRSNENTMRNLMFFITATTIQEEPTNNVFAEPVNLAARVAMAETSEKPAAPAEVREIPPELMPYLKSIRPEAIPFHDGLTTGTAPAVTDETSPTLSLGAKPLTKSLLTSEPYVAPGATESLKVGGAVSTSRGSLGPSGTFGGTKRDVVGRKATAAATPAAGTPTAKGTPGATATPSTRGGRMRPSTRGTPVPMATPRGYQAPAATPAASTPAAQSTPQ
ncbi:MAG: secretin N-terminal domain-containing protein [Candidatus Sumerlaeia bacterium]